MKNFILTLLVLLFTGCSDSILSGDQIETYDFNVVTGLEIDEYGYHRFPISTYSNGTTDQALKRFTAETNNPEIQFVYWDCSGLYIYYYNGEQFGAPIINHSSYTDDIGEAHTMFGPHSSMVGDTVMVYVGYVDSIYDVEYTQIIDIILD